MGTPDFAKICLAGIYDAGAEIVGVVTQPDKPRGRKMILTPPPVKEFALEKGIPVYQPETLRGDDFSALLSELDPELIAVAAYGKILPEAVLNYPKYGCINVHTSLLPKYRGAAPMQRAIMNGDSETGVTTMYMAKGLDTGDILNVAKTPIYENDNLESLHDRLADMGAKLLWETMCDAESGKLHAQKQDDSMATYAAKIENEDCLLDFSKSAKEVYDTIRALSPIPLAYTYLGGKMLKIVSAQPGNTKTGAPGEVVSLESDKIYVCTSDGTVALTHVLPEGKSRMSAGDFIRGRKVAIGDIMGK